MLNFTTAAASFKEEGMQISSHQMPVALLQLSNILYWQVRCTTARASTLAHLFASWASLTIIKMGCSEKDQTLNYQVLLHSLHTVG